MVLLSSSGVIDGIENDFFFFFWKKDILSSRQFF